MEPIPLQNCIEQLESLDYNPILGNRQMSKERSRQSQIPTISHLIKPKIESATSIARSLSPGPQTPRSSKRLFSETSPSPTDSKNSAKITKMDIGQMEQMFEKHLEKHFKAAEEKNVQTNANTVAELSNLGTKLTQTEQNIGTKFDHLSKQMTDLSSRQDQETLAREQLQATVGTLQGQVTEMNTRFEQSVAPDPQAIAEIMLPLVTTALSDKINSNTAEVKACNAQAKATYFQSLVNELKTHERDMMIYGYKPDGGPDLASELRTKVFKTHMDLDIDRVKAVHVGSAIGDKPKAIRVSFESVETRNSVLGKGSKLPREVRIEKCMPRRYRPKNKEFKNFAWQLKQVDDVITRTVFKGHKLVLEMKQPDEDDNKYDWTIVKEYYPEPESPTDHGEAKRSREGLKPSKTIEMIGTKVVFFSDLTVKEDKTTTVNYFTDVFLTNGDKEKVVSTNAEQVMSKRFMKVKLKDRQFCHDFKLKYEKIPFNGKNPKVSVFLGKD